MTLQRPAFSLQGVQLEVDPALEQPSTDSEVRWPHSAALRYLLLCGLNFLHDACTDECTIRIEPEGESGLLLRSVPGAVEGGHGGMPESSVVHWAPRRLAIDAVALQSLADDLNYDVEVSGEEQVRISLLER